MKINSMKTILVTGCCGMIGFATCEKLLAQGYKVVGIDNFMQSIQPNHLYQKICLDILSKNKNFIFLNADISNNIYNDIYNHTIYNKNIYVNDVLNDIDLILHLAAYPGIKYSFDNPVKVLESNQKGLIQCLELARSQKIPLLFASSSSVYGNQDEATNEAFTLTPLSVYALSKKHNEDVAKMYKDLYQVSSIGLRFFTVYGPFNRPDMLVSKILDSIANKTPLTLHNNGAMKRSFTFNADIANFILKLIEMKLKNNTVEFDVYNIGNNQNIDLLSFISIFEENMQTKANIILSPIKPTYEPNTTNCDNKKIVSKFPDVKLTDCNLGIKKTVEWFKSLK